MLSIQAIPCINEIRTAILYDQEHTIIPCVALVEGVLWPGNAPGPELALAEEFGRFPEGWNGRPVVYDHPKVDGKPVSASSPDVLEDNSFGQIFNTTLVDNKLKLEIWINNARVEALSEEAQEVIADLQNENNIVEVSTGLFTMSEPSSGTFDGEDYESIWRNIVPDHLAVLPPGVKGACSVADGCGAPRTNNMQPVMRACQLSPAPVTNACDCDDQEKGIFKRLMEAAGGLFSFTSSSEHLSDSDLRAALNVGLATAMPDSYTWILAVYQGGDDSGTFVYESGFDGALFQRTFSIDGESIAIGEEATPVRPETKFVPVTVTANDTPDSNPQENTMNEKLVNDLIANAASHFTEDDREWLNTLEEGQLTKMIPIEAEPVQTAEEIAAAATAAELVANATPDEDQPVTTAEYIDAAPEEIRQILNSHLSMHKLRKDNLITALMGNDRNTFTQESLQAKDISELESLAALAPDITYEGAGANFNTNQEETDQGFTPAVEIFAVASTQE